MSHSVQSSRSGCFNVAHETTFAGVKKEPSLFRPHFRVTITLTLSLNKMKQLRTLSVLLLVLSAFASSAQIEVGAKLGTNINQFNQPGTIFAFNGGAFARYNVLDFLAARVELLYNQQGGSRQDYSRNYSFIGGNVESIDFTNRYVHLNNLEIPVIAELHHRDFESETLVPKFLIGFAYGMNLAAVEHHDKTYYFNAGATERIMVSDLVENVRSNYKQNQLGFIVGFAIDHKIGTHTLTTEVRYRKSLTQVNNIRFGVPSLYNDTSTIPGTVGQEGDLYPSTISINFGMTIFNF